MTAPIPAVYSEDDFGDIIVDSAVAYQNGTPISITRNALSFDPQEEWENYPFPGKTMPVAGLDEVVRSRPVIKGTMMMSGEAQFLIYRPGGSWADAATAGGIITTTGIRSFTPGAFRDNLALGAYIQNLFVVWKRQRGDFIAVEFPLAMCTKYSIAANDNDEGMIAVEFEARQANDGTPSTTPPYVVYTMPADSTIPDAPPSPPTSAAPLIADWAMAEGSGSTVADDSP